MTSRSKQRKEDKRCIVGFNTTTLVRDSLKVAASANNMELDEYVKAVVLHDAQQQLVALAGETNRTEH